MESQVLHLVHDSSEWLGMLGVLAVLQSMALRLSLNYLTRSLLSERYPGMRR